MNFSRKLKEVNIEEKKRKMTKGGKQWMNRHVNDHFVKMARLQFYRSRASYKLLEIDMRYNLLKYGMKAVDIGIS